MDRLIKILRNSNKLQIKSLYNLKRIKEKKWSKNENGLAKRKLTGNKVTMSLTGKMSTGGKNLNHSESK
jgi:hypothetical protein